MNPRLAQLIGLILVIISAVMALIVYNATLEVVTSPSDVLLYTVISWGLLGLPEFIIGLWLTLKGTREARIGGVGDRLLPLVQREGRISVTAAAKELGVSQKAVADAAEKMATRRMPLMYLDRRSNEIVSPRAVELKESILHLLFAQRRMTFDQLREVTEATDEQIVEAVTELSKTGKFRGTIDENSRVIYTKEAVEELPRAVTFCPNCGGKLSSPILPGEEEYCPYCGHLITNKLGR